MATPSIYRRVWRSAATAGSLLRQCPHYTTAAAITDETHNPSKSIKQDKGKGNWVTLPPFTLTVNPVSLGKKLSHRRSRDDEVSGKEREPIETTTSALKWVLRCCPDLPTSLVHKLFRLRQVRRECLEGGEQQGDDKTQEFRLKRVGAKDLMNQGERIFLPISVQESSPMKKQDLQYSEEEMNFTRSLEFYKDSAIIAINKPPQLPVQGGQGIRRSLDELAAAYLRYDCKEPPRLVHRLDRDSSGILVMGRTQTSAAVLHSIFREKTVGVLDEKEIDWRKRTLHKRYLALVFGTPKQRSGLISAPLAKVVMDDGKSERITVADGNISSQHAVTEYKVIETSDCGLTWLELTPITGRKHQLRVHCAEVLRTPIVGDYKYGWQAHRNWKPLAFTNSIDKKKDGDTKLNYFGLDLGSGSITEKQPHLHLHCKQLLLPNISLALDHVSSDLDYDFSKLESLNLVAPLPFHMQRSWNVLHSLPQQEYC